MPVNLILPVGLNNVTINNYLDFWDDFVDEWYNNPLHAFSNNIHPWNYLYHNLLPQANALPEPYCGNPISFSAIILNYNPGSMTPAYQQHPNGSFIQMFKPNYTYRTFAIPFPYLVNLTNTPGGIFWNIRNEWIRRIIQLKLNVVTKKFPFAIDICPWHSIGWGGFHNNVASLTYVDDFVIKPAEIMLMNADIKVIFSIGKEFNTIFQNLGFNQVLNYNQNIYPHNGWPPIGGRQTIRSFSIWESPNKKKYFNTYSPGTNTCPRQDFDNIVSAII